MTEESTVNMISRNMQELGLAPGRNKSRGSKCVPPTSLLLSTPMHNLPSLANANQRIVPRIIMPRPAGPTAAGSINLTYHPSPM